jgi:alpha-glucoside transport system permease protein
VKQTLEWSKILFSERNGFWATPPPWKGGIVIFRKGGLIPWLYIGSALFFLTVYLIYPILNTAYISFLGKGSKEFTGLSNYWYVFTNADMLAALKNNLLWLVLFTSITVSLGLVIAFLTDRVRYEAGAKALIFLPMAISFVAASVIWRFMFEFRPAGVPQIGLLNAAMDSLPGLDPVAWLVNPRVNNFALIGVGIWVWTGFCMVILSAGLKSIPIGILEAARIDGASEWRIFWSIIVPMMRTTILVVATTMVIIVLKVFDIVYVMTNGNLGTEVIANRMYKEMFNYHHFGRASAIAVILLLAVIPAIVLNLRRFRAQEAMQ